MNELEAIGVVREYLRFELVSMKRSSEAEIADGLLALHHFAMPRINLDKSQGADAENHDALAAQLAIGASFSPAHYEASRVLAADYLRANKSMPLELANFAAEVLSGDTQKPKPRGPNGKASRNNTDLRDPIIATAVYYVVQELGVAATRNPENRERKSPCDLVSEILMEDLRQDIGSLRASYDMVKKTWERSAEHRRWLDVFAPIDLRRLIESKTTIALLPYLD